MYLREERLGRLLLLVRMLERAVEGAAP